MPQQANLFSDQQYQQFLEHLKERIRTSQLKAALSVNSALIQLYWQIGHDILSKQEQEGWGAKVIDRLAKDLKRAFPEMKGFSRTNLKYMRSFAQTYSQAEIGQQAVDQLPWGHNIVLLTKLKYPEIRRWYAQKTLENGWSRNILVHQIESQLYQRQGGAITNFEQTLPKPQSDLAQQIIKDPYNFDFLILAEDAQERDLEKALLANIRDFLLELGMGFAFLGSQYPVEVDGREYRIDLLFYHTQLRCYIVIDLKMGEFQPEYSGKMNFYVSAIDDQLRHPDDQPTIGLILCKTQNKTTAEYALRNLNTPIGIATHQLPEQLATQLPSIEQLELQLETMDIAGEAPSKMS
ncbi:MAG: PDDEXK nuclease domain-containing protein [Cyanobacteria bacterium P01_G01_bin.54]